MTHNKNITREKNSRGFSLGELREANVAVNRANSLGIILDFRRGTVRETNVALLKDLLNKNVEAKKQRKVDAQKQSGEVKEKVKPEKAKKPAAKKVTPKKEEAIKESKQAPKEVNPKKPAAKKAAPKKKTTEVKKTEAKEVKPKKPAAKKAAPKKEKANKE